MDIGTAKPTAGRAHGGPHHCLDLVDPSEDVLRRRLRRRRRPGSARDRRARPPAQCSSPAPVSTCGLIDRWLDLAGSWPELRAELEADPERRRAVRPPPRPRPGRRRTHRADATSAASCAPSRCCLGSGRPFSSFGPGLTVYGEPRVDQVGLRWDRARLGRAHRASCPPDDGARAARTRSSASCLRPVGCRGPPARPSATRSSSPTSTAVSRSTTPSRRSSCAPASSRSARSVGSAGTPAYAGWRSTATPSSRRCPSS